MSVDEHPEWPEVFESDFATYLKDCPDYMADGFGRLMFRHNNKVFAVVKKGFVRVDPEILVK